MIYVNDILVTKEKNKIIATQILKTYLSTEKLVLIKDDNVIIDEQEMDTILANISTTVRLNAKHSFIILREFKVELSQYILKVEEYIEETRESEDFSTVLNSFVQVTESLLDFSLVSDFLQKDLIDEQMIREISEKALEKAELGNIEYTLDLLEYELLPILHNFINETNEEI